MHGNEEEINDPTHTGMRTDIPAFYSEWFLNPNKVRLRADPQPI